MLKGNISELSMHRVRGWAREELQPETPLSLLVTDNDNYVGRILSNAYRADLAKAGIGNGRFSFDFQFPTALAPFEVHVIRVIRESDGVDIPGSPITLQPSPEFGKEAQEWLARSLKQHASDEDLARNIEFLANQIDGLLQQRADGDSMRADRDRYRRRMQGWARGQSQAFEVDVLKPILRALVIDDQLPEVHSGTASNAVLSHIRSLQRIGYKVTVAPAIEFKPPASTRSALQDTGISCCCSPYYSSVEEVMRRQAGEFDVIYLRRVTNAIKYGELSRFYFPKARQIYSVGHLQHVNLLKQAEIEGRPELVALSKRVRLAELTSVAFSGATVVHSVNEADLLKSLVPGASIFTIAWSADPKPTNEPLVRRNGVAFLGDYRQAADLDAMRWLVGDIMPLVWSKDSSISCFLVGAGLPDQIRLASDKVVTVGNVPDLAEILARVRLTVAPFAYGRGLNSNVIASLSAGVPCICTPSALDGLKLLAPLNRCIAQDPKAIAAAIIELHNIQAVNERCARSGLKFVASEFSDKKLDLSMRQLVGQSIEVSKDRVSKRTSPRSHQTEQRSKFSDTSTPRG